MYNRTGKRKLTEIADDIHMILYLKYSIGHTLLSISNGTARADMVLTLSDHWHIFLNENNLERP
jgi:hypothetical protein